MHLLGDLMLLATLWLDVFCFVLLTERVTVLYNH